MEGGYLKRQSIKLMFTSSDSSREESESGSSTSSKNANIKALKQLQFELKRQRNDINEELAVLSIGFNLAIFMIIGLYSFTWYLIGIQWLREPMWGLEIKCNLDELEKAEWTFYDKRNFSSPDPKAYKVYEPGCVYYDYNYFTYAKLTYEEASEQLRKEPKPQILKCVNYAIKIDIPKEVSHIREFNIVCLKKPLQSPKLYVHFGVFAFGFPTGLLADIYGRRPVHNFCAVLCCIVSFLIPFSTNLAMFAITTSIMGGTLYVCNMLLCIIFSEVFRNKYRAFNTLLAFGWYFVGFTHPESIFKFAEVWRFRKLIVAISIFAFVIGAIMVVPESPRLLFTRRQFKTSWDWLHELGSTEISDTENFVPPKINWRYQLKIFTRSYLLNRIYGGILLNVVATFFYYVFKQMHRTILKPTDSLNFQLLGIHVILLLCTGILMVFSYSRKTLLCIYYILLSLSIITNTMGNSNLIEDVAALAGKNFAAVIYILTIIYLIEAIPTSHRATSLGLYLTVNHFFQSLAEMFIDDLMFESTGDTFFTFYCGICMVCALISLMIADTGEDVPDRKEDLLLDLPFANENFVHENPQR